MVDECSETRIHGRLGWKAMPFARDDLDSNLVSIEGLDEEAIAGSGSGSLRPKQVLLHQSLRGQAVE